SCYESFAMIDELSRRTLSADDLAAASLRYAAHAHRHIRGIWFTGFDRVMTGTSGSGASPGISIGVGA
ncbi:MAG: hypothetical protein ACRECN_03890, partial [Methylocella sp.]